MSCANAPPERLGDTVPSQVTSRASFRALALAVVAYAIAMGYLEAAAVVYLRDALGVGASVPASVSIGLGQLETAEMVREAATLVMIAAVGLLAGGSGLERFAWAAVVFGTWDIVYYLGQYAISGWPPTLVTWDVLFLLPAIWVGPVWAPVTVSVALICGGLFAAWRLRAGFHIVVRPLPLAAALAGALLVVASFLVDGSRVLAGDLAPWSGWPLLIGGILLGAAGTLPVIARAQRPGGSSSGSVSHMGA